MDNMNCKVCGMSLSDGHTHDIDEMGQMSKDSEMCPECGMKVHTGEMDKHMEMHKK